MSDALRIVALYLGLGFLVGVLVTSDFWQRRVLHSTERFDPKDTNGVVLICALAWPVALLLGAAAYFFGKDEHGS